MQYKVFIAVEFEGLTEEAHKEIAERLEEHGIEKIPTVSFRMGVYLRSRG